MIDELRPAFPVLQVGIVGHRTLPEGEQHRLLPAIQEVLLAIRQESAAVTERPQDLAELWRSTIPLCRCVTALAEGADRLAGAAALEFGYELSVVLPFPRGIYERDFASADSKAAFGDLLRRATSVLELEGETEAYLAAGEVLLNQSDLLLALWDGQPSRGAGGTADIVDRAISRDIVVIVIDVNNPDNIRLLQGGSDWKQALRSEIVRLLLPPWIQTGQPPPSALTRLLKAADDSVDWPRLVCRGYERLLLIGARQGNRETPEPQGLPHGRPDVALPAPASDTARAFHGSDRLAIDYGNRYRAASILRLAVVFVALVGAFIGFYGTKLSLPTWTEPLGFTLQFVALATVLLLYHINVSRAWHASFLDLRYVAEQLRFAGIFAGLGRTPPAPRPAPFHSGYLPDWAGWYLRSILRPVGLLHACMSREYVGDVRNQLTNLLQDQIEFYERRSIRYSIFAVRLNWLANACYWVGLGLAAARVIVYSEWSSDLVLRSAANMATLVVPALAPIFIGLRAQGEYARLSQRYSIMVQELRVILADLAQPHLTSGKLGTIVHQAASLTAAEVADWRILIQSRSISRI